jgi:TonB family protein
MKMALALLFPLGAAAVGIGCGSDKAARNPGGPEHAMRRPTSSGIEPADTSGMEVDNELGVVETADVEAALANHFDAIRDCYQHAGKAQRYAGGRVALRFLINGDGTTQDVLVTESPLGNYEVERCVVSIGRKIVFRAPAGNKATTFEYAVEFRSSNQLAVLDIDGMKVEHDVAAFLPQLASCGQLAPEEANAIIYIEPNGLPGSVGIAANVPIDEDVGDCMVQTIRRWKMSATLPGRAMRATFSIPPTFATADARRVAHRRRH